jgi:ADP-ribose pyrophosphatase
MSTDEVRTIHRGHVVTLNLEQVTLPNGNRTELEIVRHPGASAVVPLTDSGNVLLIRQYRHAASGSIVEVPAGKLDAGEEPDVCAGRELEEEAGVRAGRLHKLGHILTTPGFSDEVIHLYLATELQSGTQALEHDEVLTVEEVPFTEALRWCRDGVIIDAKSVCALMLAAAHLGQPL